MKLTTYEVRVTIEVLNHNVKDHRGGHFVKRYEINAGEFGDGKPNSVDRDQAKRFAKRLNDSVVGTVRTAHVFASED
jgi:hypothetical protein